MKAFTKEQRRVVARRLFEALRVHYPNRYISLIGRPVSTKLMIVGGTAIQSTMTIAASKAAPPALGCAQSRVLGLTATIKAGRTKASEPVLGGQVRLKLVNVCD